MEDWRAWSHRAADWAPHIAAPCGRSPCAPASIRVRSPPSCRPRRPRPPSRWSAFSPISSASSCPVSRTGSIRASSPISRRTLRRRPSSPSNWSRRRRFSACVGRPRRRRPSSRPSCSIGSARPLTYRRRFAASFRIPHPPATLAAVLTMRERALAWQGNSAGLSGAPRLRIYASPEAHSSIDRAVWFSGIGADNLVRVPIARPARAMDAARLEGLIAADRAAGYLPAGVIAVVGATSVGATDDVAAIAEVCARENLYLHVDAAWAGAAMICPNTEPFGAAPSVRTVSSSTRTNGWGRRSIARRISCAIPPTSCARSPRAPNI